jgi:hypothetical protein
VSFCISTARFREAEAERGTPDLSGAEQGAAVSVEALAQGAVCPASYRRHEDLGRPVVDLANVSEERVQELVERAWRNKAPKRVVAAYDAR